MNTTMRPASRRPLESSLVPATGVTHATERRQPRPERGRPPSGASRHSAFASWAWASVAAIGRKLGVSSTQAFRYVHDVLKDLAKKTEKAARELRQLESERLDLLWRRLLPKVEVGDPRAIQAAVRVAQRRCSLYGLDGPKQLEHSGREGGPIEHEQTVFYIPKNDRDPPAAGAAGTVPGQPG